MSHKHESHEDAGHGGDRPWVYFMIDCFFLVTQFFVITFHVRSEEVLLPQKLPPGGTRISIPPVAPEDKLQMSVHVTHRNNQPLYECKQLQVNISQLTEKLRSAAMGSQKVQVRVSYESDVPFEDVMAVFNACSKVNINECGLRPLRID